ncbi:diguanylate cyclase [Levilinea saccharolytica]|nr:diguanylate cyclase [Levilinea saccharolytica]
MANRLRASPITWGQSARLIPFWHVETMVTTDTLTHLYTRQGFLASAKRYLGPQADHTPVSALMVDVDHLQQINDQFGWTTGDFVLLRLAEVFRAALRKEDLLARYGGEEFILLMPGAGPEPAFRVAERLRRAAEQLEITSGEGPVSVTVSVGIASSPTAHLSLVRLVNQASQALRRAKHNGCNQVCALEDESLRLQEKTTLCTCPSCTLGVARRQKPDEEGVIRILLDAMSLRDPDFVGHARRTATMAVQFAEALQLDPPTVEAVRQGALLHDIGKVCIPDAVLLKPGLLNEEERGMVRVHPEYGSRFLSVWHGFQGCMEIPRFHHEWWDGSGYPYRLGGTQIPLAARMFAIVDVWDALGMERSYRPAWTGDEIVEFLYRERGTHFDPHLVDVFLDLLIRSRASGGRLL